MKFWSEVVVPHINRAFWLPLVLTLGVLALVGLDGYRRLNDSGWSMDLILGHQRNVAQVRKEQTALVESENEALRARLQEERTQHERELAAARERETAARIATQPTAAPNTQTGINIVTPSNTSVVVIGNEYHDGDSTVLVTNGWRVHTASTTELPTEGAIVTRNGNHHCDCTREHFVPVRVVNGDYIKSCDEDIPEPPQPTEPSAITNVLVVNGNYYCTCESRHGANVQVVNGSELPFGFGCQCFKNIRPWSLFF